MRRQAAVHESPARRRAHAAAATAQAVTGHASYRVRHASAKTMPGDVASEDVGAELARPWAFSINIATPIVVSASRSGSVIGVACRYSTFGLRANTAAPMVAASAELVSARTIQAIA